MLRNGTEFVRLRGGEQKCAKKYGVVAGGTFGLCDHSGLSWPNGKR